MMVTTPYTFAGVMFRLPLSLSASFLKSVMADLEKLARRAKARLDAYCGVG